MNENDLFNFLLENWAMSSLGELSDENESKLNGVAGQWKAHVSTQIAESLVTHIIKTKYAIEIKNNMPMDWDSIVQTVIQQLKDYMKSGPISNIFKGYHSFMH